MDFYAKDQSFLGSLNVIEMMLPKEIILKNCNLFIYCSQPASLILVGLPNEAVMDLYAKDHSL